MKVNICGRTPQEGADARAPRTVAAAAQCFFRSIKKTAQIEQHKAGGCNDRGKYDQSSGATVFPEFVEDDLRQPLMRYPGVPGTSEGKRVGVGDMAGFDDPLPGAQMPPKIGIGGRACRHAEQTE